MLRWRVSRDLVWGRDIYKWHAPRTENLWASPEPCSPVQPSGVSLLWVEPKGWAKVSCKPISPPQHSLPCSALHKPCTGWLFPGTVPTLKQCFSSRKSTHVCACLIYSMKEPCEGGRSPQETRKWKRGVPGLYPIFSQVRVISPEPRTFLENISSKVTQLTQRLETWWPAMWKQMLEIALLFLWGVLNPFQSLLSAWAMRHFCSSTTLVGGVWLSLCARTLVSGLLASRALAPSHGPFDWPAGDFILSSSPLLTHSTVLVLWTRKSSTMFLFDSNGGR